MKIGGNRMKKRFSIYHFLVALLAFTLIMPASVVDAGAKSEEGTLTIHKYEQEPDEVDTGEEGTGQPGQNAPGTPLAGVTYKVTQTHFYNDGVWTEITDDNPVHELTTGDDGTVSKKLPLGRYTVVEIDGPDHVILNDETFTVDIPMTNADGSGPLNYDVHIYPKNETIRGAVELYKYDGGTEEPLEGVYFKLYDEDGNKIDKGKTDENGILRVENLPHGNYYFKEVKTLEGYLLGDQKIEFSITKDNHNKTINIYADNYKEPKEVVKEVDSNAVNRGETVEYTITVDLPTDIYSYKNFVVTDELDENLEYVDGSATSPIGFTFSADGQNLTWTLTDKDNVSSGPATFTFKAKVAEDAPANEPIENTAMIEYENRHGFGGEKESNPVTVTPTVGSIEVIKQDGDNEEALEGATFELYGPGGNLIATKTTNSDGTIYFGDLDYGTYELVETKAPSGYSLKTDSIEVIINEDNHNAKVTVLNYQSDWDLPTTGGIGTTLFTLVGLMLMGSAVFMIIRRRNGDTA